MQTPAPPSDQAGPLSVSSSANACGHSHFHSQECLLQVGLKACWQACGKRKNLPVPYKPGRRIQATLTKIISCGFTWQHKWKHYSHSITAIIFQVFRHFKRDLLKKIQSRSGSMVFLAKEMLLIKNEIFTGDPRMIYPIISFPQIRSEPLSGIREAIFTRATSLAVKPSVIWVMPFVKCLEFGDVYEKLL